MMRNSIMVGERVYLRPLELDDAELMAYGDMVETDDMMERGRIPGSPIAYRRYIEDGQPKPANATPPEVHFSICLRGEPNADTAIGAVNIDHIDWINRTGETGSGLLPAYRNQGYGTEAKHLLLEYAFDRLQLHIIESHVWEPNTRSAAALAKQGYRLAGRLKWDELHHGVYRDVLVFDVLRDEWLHARDTWQQQQNAGQI